MGEDTKENNVVDFVAYKLRHMENTHANDGNLDYAYALHEALQQYLDGIIKIVFSEGSPRVIRQPQSGIPNTTDDSDD